MFTREEIEALVVGARMVEAWTTEQLSTAARQALQKIEAALPERLKAEMNRPQIYAVDWRTRAGVRESLDVLRLAISNSRRVAFKYKKEDGAASRRAVQPLGLYFWGNLWTLASWCELRGDFRNLRVDRMSELACGEPFEPVAGRSLEDFLKQMRSPPR